MSHLAAAGRSFTFESLLATCPLHFREALRNAGLTKPLDCACFFEHEPGPPEAHAELRTLACELGAGTATEEWAKYGQDLHALSCKEAPRLARALARVDGLQLTADLVEHSQATHRDTERKDLRLLAAHSLSELPREWRGRRYR